MRPISSEELKQIQVSILDEVHKFCVEHNIKYFLAFGTLIGAVRHNGYIPWDDDIDILMPRPDYERFVREFCHENLDTFHFNSSRKDLIVFCKVFDKRTTFIEESSLNYEGLGVNIDVFPFDGLSSDYNIAQKHVRNVMRWTTISIIKKMSIKHKRVWYKTLTIALLQMILSIIPYRYVIGKICNLMKKYDYESSKYVVHLYDAQLYKIMPKDVFEELMLIDFEGRKFYAPKNYHEYLTTYYGDYMKLPPVEKRQSHHFYEAYWKV